MTTCACFSETRDLDETRVDALSGMLSAAERRRSDRFWRWPDRRDYIAAHALLRMVLAEQTNTSPEQLTFDVDDNGKPYLVHASGEAPPAFSLTHARGLVACVVAEGTVGIDAEPVNPAIDAVRLASRFFSADEAADLQRCSARDRPTRFYELWTLKEALLKAVGTGLASGLDSVSFRVEGHHVSLTTRLAPFAEVPWVFVVGSVAGSHTLALAISDAGRRRLPVSITKWDLARPVPDGATHLTAYGAGGTPNSTRPEIEERVSQFVRCERAVPVAINRALDAGRLQIAMDEAALRARLPVPLRSASRSAAFIHRDLAFGDPIGQRSAFAAADRHRTVNVSRRTCQAGIGTRRLSQT